MESNALRNKCLDLAKRKLRVALGIPDRRIMHAVAAIGELEEMLSVNVERLREWYMLYYPEAVARIRKQDAFVRIASERKERSEFHDIPADSVGADLSGKDLFTLRNYARALSNLYTQKIEIEEYLERLMKQNFPNLQAIAGTIVGARLIGHCGDAERLAHLPSSTIQVLGAEKALFRHMKTGAKPPKYGIILSHNLLQNARRDDRGKIARALASVICMAIKIDVYGKRDSTVELIKKLEDKLETIKRHQIYNAKKKELGQYSKPQSQYNKPDKISNPHGQPQQPNTYNSRDQNNRSRNQYHQDTRHENTHHGRRERL